MWRNVHVLFLFCSPLTTYNNPHPFAICSFQDNPISSFHTNFSLIKLSYSYLLIYANTFNFFLYVIRAHTSKSHFLSNYLCFFFPSYLFGYLIFMIWYLHFKTIYFYSCILYTFPFNFSLNTCNTKLLIFTN